MPRKKITPPKKTRNYKPRQLKLFNEPPKTQKVENSVLGDVLLGAGGEFNPYGVQLSQSTTLFKNLRWYLISNMRQLLSELYVEIGLVQTMVDVPVDDAFRGGVEIVTKQLEPEQIYKLQSTMEREGDILSLAQAMKWTRLFGGGGVLIITDQDPKKPLNIAAIKNNTPLKFHGVDMWELFWGAQNLDDTDVMISANEEADQLPESMENYDYYGETVNQTRVMRMKGLIAPSFVRPRLRGWGFSVIEALVRPLNQFLKASDLSFEVLDEFKIDVFKIKNLANTLLGAGGTAIVKNRIAIANAEKNYNNAITMDSEDDYAQKQLSFAGLGETMDQIRKQLASEMRMPMTKLFGQSASGFSSGEDDIENYNAMIESTIRSQVKFPMLTLVELRCQQLFGFIPDDLSIKFQPLRVLSAEGEENVKTQQFNRAIQARQAGEITSEEFRDIANKDELLSIQLDKDVSLELEQVEETEDTDKEEK